MLGAGGTFRRQVSLLGLKGSSRTEFVRSKSAGAKHSTEHGEEDFSTFEAPLSLKVSMAQITDTAGRRTRLEQARLASCALSYATIDIRDRVYSRSMLNPKSRSLPSLTLVLDLDDTCVRSLMDYGIKGAEGDSKLLDCPQATVFYRPFLVPMMRALRVLGVEILVFTASQQTYSDSILDLIDPERELISERFYRQHTVPHPQKSSLLCKDLSVLGRNLNRCLLIDDMPGSSALNPLNAWRILPYSRALRYGAVHNIIGRRHQEARFRKYCAPVLLNPVGGGGGGGEAPPSHRCVIGVQQPDFALLNLFAMIKWLLRTGSDIPTFTQKYKSEIHRALVTEAGRMWLPNPSYYK